jgi:hypothetical protein
MRLSAFVHNLTETQDRLLVRHGLLLSSRPQSAFGISLQVSFFYEVT